MRTSRRLSIGIIFVLMVELTTGCSKMLGGLRKDFDDGEVDSPTGQTARSSGSWPERGYMDEDEPESDLRVGHADRSIASTRSNTDPRNGSWVSPEMSEQNRRDLYRGVSPETEELAAANGVSPVDPKRLQPKKRRTTKEDFEDRVKNEGSLWASDGQTNYYFTKNKIRGPGDIVTVNIEKDLMKEIVLEATRNLSEQEFLAELDDAQVRLDAEAADGVKSSAAAPTRSPAGVGSKKKEPAKTAAKGKADAQKASQNGEEEPEVPKGRKAIESDIDISKSLMLKEGDVLMAEIVERYPNGNFKIKSTKRVPYRTGFRTVTVVGIVKGSEISEDDKVSSGKMYEYRTDVASR